MSERSLQCCYIVATEQLQKKSLLWTSQNFQTNSTWKKKTVLLAQWSLTKIRPIF